MATINDVNNNDINKLYDNMSKFQKETFDKMKNNPDFFTNYSLNDILFDFDNYFVEYILNIELDLYLKNNNDDNKKNGYTKNINIKMKDRVLNFNRPRLRKEKEFDSSLIPKRTRIMKDITNNIVLLYSKNNSLNDIKDILKGMFNLDLSTATISNLAQTISQDVLAWRNRELQPFYFTINIDCTYIDLRDNASLNSHKIPIYMAIGTSLTGNKEILGIYLGNEDENKSVIDSIHEIDIAESKTFWLNIFNDLKDRGLKKVLYVVSDGISGIQTAVESEFVGAKHQRCVVHLVRNLKQYTTKANCKEILADFKSIYSANNLELAEINYKDFLEKYKNNKTIIKHVTEYYSYIRPLFNEPEAIRKYIYTNNIIESANSVIKRGFYGRGALPNIDSAINIIYVNLLNLENKWQKTKVNNWDKIYHELYITHYDEIKDYL